MAFSPSAVVVIGRFANVTRDLLLQNGTGGTLQVTGHALGHIPMGLTDKRHARAMSFESRIIGNAMASAAEHTWTIRSSLQ